MDKREKFIRKARARHGNKYDYSKVVYSDSLTKVIIICPVHGEFSQTPQAHVRGNGCPKCANIKRGDTFRSDGDTFVRKAAKVHGGKYIYDKEKYVNATTKVPILCMKHGTFWMTPMNHLMGQGCPKCSGRGLTTSDVVSLFMDRHGDKYDYSKVEFKKMHEKVCIICPEHGEFWQTPSKHLSGQGCPECGIRKRSKSKTMTTDAFKERANAVHGNRYTYDRTVYTGTYDDLTITCPIHGDFTQRANDHLNGHGCPHCGNNMSRMEDEVCQFLSGLGVEYERNDRTVLEGSEIDILIPGKGIGIECDGLKWHSEEFKENDYHLRKTNECEERGIHLIHVYEDEWSDRKEIVKDKLVSVLGRTPDRIYARKCRVGIPSEEEKRAFIDETHIQGDVPCSVKIGLYYQDALVAVMTFGRPRLPLGHKTSGDGKYELLRYSTRLNTCVIGGASKLFRYFVDNYDPEEVTSYCDRRFSVGNMYEKLGFRLDHVSKPNYYYVVGNNRKNRFRYRKSELVKCGYDESKSEHEIMLERGIYRIYDCGNLVYKWLKRR